jgi:hypothetical protein
MHNKKTKIKKRTNAKPISLYPLRPEEALRLFMQVDPTGIVKPRGGNKRKKR